MRRHRRRSNLAERFWIKVKKTEGCWVWTGYRDPHGYGRFWHVTGQQLAHRVAYELAYGPITGGECVLHRCDNPSCVRPDHLWLGDMADNTHDMIQKGRAYRGGSRQGERNGHHKLTQQQVNEIRGRYVPHKVGYAVLGREYGVDESTVYCVVRGKTWRNVPTTNLVRLSTDHA